MSRNAAIFVGLLLVLAVPLALGLGLSDSGGEGLAQGACHGGVISSPEETADRMIELDLVGDWVSEAYVPISCSLVAAIPDLDVEDVVAIEGNNVAVLTDRGDVFDLLLFSFDGERFELRDATEFGEGGGSPRLELLTADSLVVVVQNEVVRVDFDIEDFSSELTAFPIAADLSENSSPDIAVAQSRFLLIEASGVVDGEDRVVVVDTTDGRNFVDEIDGRLVGPAGPDSAYVLSESADGSDVLLQMFPDEESFQSGRTRNEQVALPEDFRPDTSWLLPDGRVLATDKEGGIGGDITLLARSGVDLEGAALLDSDGDPYDFALMNDGRIVLATVASNDLQMLRPGFPAITSVLHGHRRNPSALAVVADGTLVSGGDDGLLAWQAPEDVPESPLGFRRFADVVELHPQTDGTVLAAVESGFNEEDLRMWTRDSTLATMLFPQFGIENVVFGADQLYLFSQEGVAFATSQSEIGNGVLEPVGFPCLWDRTPRSIVSLGSGVFAGDLACDLGAAPMFFSTEALGAAITLSTDDRHRFASNFQAFDNGQVLTIAEQGFDEDQQLEIWDPGFPGSFRYSHFIGDGSIGVAPDGTSVVVVGDGVYRWSPSESDYSLIAAAKELPLEATDVSSLGEGMTAITGPEGLAIVSGDSVGEVHRITEPRHATMFDGELFVATGAGFVVGRPK